MGAAGSVQPNEITSDPEWSPQPHSQPTTSNGLTGEEEATCVNSVDKDNEVITAEEEMRLKQIEDLGKIIQNLASDNLKLLNSNRELKQKCEQQESRWNEKVSCEEESFKYSQIVTSLQEDAANDKKLIEDLKQQLQINTKNNAVEVEKYHENLNFMHLKVKEYEQIVGKLEKDAAIQSEAIQSFQGSLLSSHNQEKEAEENASGGREDLETLRQENKLCQEKCKALMEQLEMERNTRRKMNEENHKLQEELQYIKQKVHVNSDNGISEHADYSDMDLNGETDKLPVTSNSNKTEEARTLSPRAVAELEVFQKQLKVKREARHKALSAISMEMERLRSELNREREVRRNAVKELENARCMSDEHHILDEVNHLKLKLTLERQEKDKICKEMLEIQKQGNKEIEHIMKELEKEKAKTQNFVDENKYIKEQLEESDHLLQLRLEENSQLQNKLETDKEKYQQQVLALKDVVAISKQMLTVRENQVTHLKQTLQDIEVSVIEKHRGSLTAGLRAEYETQMENIKTLKALYEERMQVMNVEKERLVNEQKELQRLIEEQKMSVETLETTLQEKEKIISERNSTVSDLQDQLSEAIDQSRNLSYELTLINNMFTQILGCSDMDLDRLTKLLQENHDLITEITTNSDCSETTASLPKLLLDLVCNAESNSDKNAECIASSESEQTDRVGESVTTGYALKVSTNGSPLAMQDISSNLPKVWKVLLELVSHHVPSPTEESSEDSRASCYKSVDTPYGPKNVISVSKTFLRLKDLILQKKSLQKEVTRLKELNVHLETKLNDQERRLSLVSTELRKTWNVVDHMRVQHQQLHTHEKVLRFELQQKRKLLMELKEELEYCREKWEEARQKNSQSESDWQKLRTEFALRKSKPLNNSGESGFSEEKDEDGCENDVTKIQSQRKFSSSGDESSSHDECVGQTVMKTDDSDVVTNSTMSLPDLVSVTTDLQLATSNVTVSGSSTSSYKPNSDNGDPISHLPNIVQDDTSILEPSILEECPTVSLITLLKQQLSCFSKNLEIITTDFDTNDHFRALQSIFSLPAIQIPDHLNTSAEVPSPFSMISNTDRATRASVDRGIQCTEECQGHVDKEDNSICERVSSEHENEVVVSESIVEPAIENSFSASSIPESTDEEKGASLLPFTETVELMDNPCETDTYSPVENIQTESQLERLQRVERQCQQLFNKVTRGSEAKSSVTSSEELQGCTTKNLEDMLDARAERLKRLEEQSQQLFKKVSRTTHRSEALSNRLEELHEQYGSEEVPGSAATDLVTQDKGPDPSLNKISDPPSLLADSKTSDLKTLDSPEKAATSNPVPSTSTCIPPPPPLEEMLDARAARLKRLEEQSQQVFNKVTKTTSRSATLSNRLEELHEQYGSEETRANPTVDPLEILSNPSPTKIPEPPPLPDYLPSSNLPSSSNVARSSELNENASPCPVPSTSSSHIPPPPLEEMLDARAARLKRLEEQSQQLFKKVKKTTHRSVKLSNRLQELHEQYGNNDSSETAMNISVANIPSTPPLPGHTTSIELSNSLSSSTSVHIPVPPPLPAILPSVHLPTEIDNSRQNVNVEEKSHDDDDDDER